MQEDSPKKCNTPVYSYASLQGIKPTDGLPVRYAWIDQNIHTKHNRSDLEAFRQLCSVEPFADYASFAKFLVNFTPKEERLRVICSASLPDEFYKLLQGEEKIERAMLYCFNLTKAGILMSEYPKIKKACLQSQSVVRTISRWEKQQIESLNFWEDKDIANLHRNTVNWRCLLCEQSNSGKSLQKAFMEYCRRVVRQRMVHEINTLEGVEITSKEVLFQYALNSELLFPEVNRLLRSTKDPQKLAYIRWPTSWLFNFIKQRYHNANCSQNTSYFAVLSLNSEEKRRLEPGKFINIRQFIQARRYIPLLQEISEETIFQIQVNSCKQICNGYIRHRQGAVFNLGNFYRIQSVNQSDKTVTVSLLTFNQSYPLKQDDPLSSIMLYQVRLDGQKVWKYGQWYSLFLSGKHVQADIYSDRQVQLMKRNSVRWGLIRQSITVKNCGDYTRSLDFLLSCRLIIESEQNKRDYQVRIILGMAEIILYEKEDSFIDIYHSLVESLQRYNGKTPLPQKQITIFEIAFELLFRAGGPTAQSFHRLQSFEEQLVEDNPLTVCADLYQLCLFLKCKYFKMAGEPQAEIRTLNRLLWILGSTEGHQNHRYKKINQLKQEAFERLYRKEYEQDMKLKRTLLTSDISVQDLIDRDQLLKIDLSSTNIAIFGQT